MDEQARVERLEALLEQCSGHVDSSVRAVCPDPSERMSLGSSSCTINTLERWLQALERSLVTMYATVQSTCGRSADGPPPLITQPPMILSDWLAREKVARSEYWWSANSITRMVRSPSTKASYSTGAVSPPSNRSTDASRFAAARREAPSYTLRQTSRCEIESCA